MKFPDDTGLLLTICDGLIDNGTILLRSIDNYAYPFRDFVRIIRDKELFENKDKDYLKVPRLYIIAGHKNKVASIERVWKKRITQFIKKNPNNKYITKNVEKKIEKIKFYCLESFYWFYLSEIITECAICHEMSLELDDEKLMILVFYHTTNFEDDSMSLIKQVISFWIKREQPMLKGYQCFNRSFMLRNLTGRKILTTIPDMEGNWGLVLEGGLFLPLADDFETGLCKLNSSHLNQWTIGEVEGILMNPVYAFGYYYHYMDTASEWIYVFLYALATIDKEKLSDIDLENLYRNFCVYIGKHISPYTRTETII